MRRFEGMGVLVFVKVRPDDWKHSRGSLTEGSCHESHRLQVICRPARVQRA
jgi:hypothetical protein